MTLSEFHYAPVRAALLWAGVCSLWFAALVPAQHGRNRRNRRNGRNVCNRRNRRNRRNGPTSTPRERFSGRQFFRFEQNTCVIVVGMKVEQVEQVAVRLGIGRIAGNGTAVADDGLVEATDVLVKQTEIVMCKCKIRFDGKGLGAAGDGVVDLPEQAQADAEIIVRFGEPGIDVESAPVTVHRCVGLPCILQDDPHVVVRFIKAVVKRGGPFETVERILDAFEPEQDQSQTLQRGYGGRIELQNPVQTRSSRL